MVGPEAIVWEITLRSRLTSGTVVVITEHDRFAVVSDTLPMAIDIKRLRLVAIGLTGRLQLLRDDH